MYEFIEGTVTWRGADCVVAVGGIGYLVRVGQRTKHLLEKDMGFAGQAISQHIFVHHRVREEEESLYGFYTAADRDLFEALLTVERVGPATALGIVDLGEPENVWQAIRLGNVAFLRRARGCGDKAAGNIVLALAKKGSA